MKNYMVILTLAVISLGLICGGCGSKKAAVDEPAAIQPSVKEAEPVAAAAEPATEVKVESAAEAKAEKPAAPARPTRTRGRGLYGEWQVKIDYNERQMESILLFSRNSEGNLTGKWISFRGMNELTNVTFEDGKLGFVQTYQGRDGQTRTSTFAGTVEEGKISGTVTSNRGEYKLTGQRSRRMPRVVGNWKMKMGDREFTSTLAVTADNDGKLSAKWQSERGEHEVTDVKYERRTLTFKRNSKMGDRQWESTFEGTVQGNVLTGVFKSERGEIVAEGKRIGGALIGNWNLEVTSERGSRQQRLKVNPDMSGMYGATPIEKINLEDSQVSFKIVLEFGDRKFEMDFAGKLEDSKLTGELTTSRGTQKITGTKVVRRRRRTG
ncbi:MAG: hypothetical protein ACYSTR_06280 [Planctomycetota bacterium]|jgi:hypothetical protein